MEMPIIYSFPTSTSWSGLYLHGGIYMGYIGDSIGTDYMTWEAGASIFISSPTGSGKTTFILETFLPYLAKERKRMLYLVNRTILKNQIEKRIKRLDMQCQMAIKVELYQTIENIYHMQILQEYCQYDYVVCDEAHYFLSDSNYNTRTFLSFKFVREHFVKKVRIFISATIEQIEEYVRMDNLKDPDYYSRWLGIRISNDSRTGIISHISKHVYSAERNYDYVDVGILNRRDEIIDIVCKGDEKWLIFVDSKGFGNSLKKELESSLSCKESYNQDLVAFITSGYKSDPDSMNQVKSIISDRKQSAKILIATSVLDNGISLEDEELRNMIIIADTETEFIQMLGRKRKDNQRLKLYIYKQDKDYFTKRNRIAKKREEFVNDYYVHVGKEVMSCIYPNVPIQAINTAEQIAMNSRSLNLIKHLFNNDESADCIRSSFFYSEVEGVVYLNLLALHNLQNLTSFYDKLLSEFDTYGENAFLREQLQWLNKSEEEIEQIISESEQTSYEKSRKIVIDELNSIKGNALTKEKFIKTKNGIRNELVELIKHVDHGHPDYNKYMQSVKKNDRVISTELMNFLRENCDIPFEVTQTETKDYIVKVES